MKNEQILSKNTAGISGSASGRRLSRIDLIRGFAVLSMIFYHAVWDLVYIFQFQWTWFRTDWAYLWQQSICITFIAVSGFSGAAAKRRPKRGLILLGIGALLGVITIRLTPELPLIFGILSFLGSSMILLSLLHPLLSRCRPATGIFVNLILFGITKQISEGVLMFPPFGQIRLPYALYSNYISAFFGFPFPKFSSTDYFPIFPWIFLFFAGFFTYLLLKEDNKLHILIPSSIPIVEKLGRHSLCFYLIHQPVLLGIFHFLF